MEVFNKQIFGVDAERFLAKTSEEKKEWILKHTNQRNESIINKFIERLPQVPPKEKECLNCGTLNDKIENHFKAIITRTINIYECFWNDLKINELIEQ